MHTVTSNDGTAIAYDQTGSGPAIILVGGALSDRSAAVQMAALLAPHFTVVGYDRRGRGDSGDTAPYAVEREIEDIGALVRAVGGTASLYGMSSGAVLCLRSAAYGLPITKLALYEPPLIVDDTRPAVPADYVPRLGELAASGRRDEAVEYFLTNAVQVPAEMVAQMRQTPMWPGMAAIAHTLAYDGAIMGDTMSGSPESLRQFASVPIPTLVMDGGASAEWMHHGVAALAGVLPHSERRTFAGQTHAVDPNLLVPALIEFFCA
jgi:pimeloyl-ACP methyl ester carboxylesterase